MYAIRSYYVQNGMQVKKPELLAPAGGRAQLEAAVWAGTDAVYFGLDSGLNARVRATSFGGLFRDVVVNIKKEAVYLHNLLPGIVAGLV